MQPTNEPIIELNGDKGHYKVDGKIWIVGSKYKVLDRLGIGAYGMVCQGMVKETSHLVAIKRIEDVMQDEISAKKSLREVCIMRRMSHPNILSLVDAFTNFSDQDGRTDLYIVTEFADRGNLYRIKDPLSEDEVKTVMWQILLGIQYMHSSGVWHRDIKSENVLLVSPLTVKICDFNLARSVEEISSDWPEQDPHACHKRAHTKRRYTKMVATRNYRAPEVIMSEGEYTSAIDMWGLGCIFWELLKRVAEFKTYGDRGYSGCLFYPEVEELHAPGEKEIFITDRDKFRFKQLNGIFDVLGTPTWKDIQSIPSHMWRKYLQNLPGRAGHLSATLGIVDAEALDLLSRLLAFDPSRRCTAEEAIVHRYFTEMHLSKSIRPGLQLPPLHDVKHPSLALQILENEIDRISGDGNGLPKLTELLKNEVQQQEKETNTAEDEKRSWPNFDALFHGSQSSNSGSRKRPADQETSLLGIIRHASLRQLQRALGIYMQSEEGAHSMK